MEQKHKARKIQLIYQLVTLIGDALKLQKETCRNVKLNFIVDLKKNIINNYINDLEQLKMIILYSHTDRKKTAFKITYLLHKCITFLSTCSLIYYFSLVLYYLENKIWSFLLIVLLNNKPR